MNEHTSTFRIIFTIVIISHTENITIIVYVCVCTYLVFKWIWTLFFSGGASHHAIIRRVVMSLVNFQKWGKKLNDHMAYITYHFHSHYFFLTCTTVSYLINDEILDEWAKVTIFFSHFPFSSCICVHKHRKNVLKECGSLF